jgi:molecular chaperone DnaK
LSDNDKAPLEAAIKKARETAQGTDVNAIKSAVSELEQASHAFSKTLYEAGAKPGAGAAPGADGTAAAGGSSEDDAIDAEFEVKDTK